MMSDLLVGIFIILLSVIVLFTYQYILWPRKPKNFPPGPRGYPLVGNALQLGVQPYKGAIRMARDYGNILGVTLGFYRAVIVNDPDDIRETCNKNAFNGKGIYNPNTDQNPGVANAGLIYSEGQIWTDERKFCLKTLRDFGAGRQSLESIIVTEAEELIQRFRKTGGTPFETKYLFNAPIFNVLWHVIAAERFSRDDPKLRKMIKLLHDFMRNLTGVRLLFYLYPWMVKLNNKLPFLFPQSNRRLKAQLWKFFDETIEEHRNSMVADNPRDFIDSYLINEQKKGSSSYASIFSSSDKDEGLKLTLLDMFIAGIETSSTMLCWSIFLLARHPQVQLKLYNEICRVTKAKAVTLKDRPRLPFSQAVICEVSRIATPVPLVPHSISEDVILKGFSIPKHTHFLPNLYAVHNSKEIWRDPENFRPERFLNEEDKSFVHNPNVMVFSVGKRSCIGELLARDEIFIFLANLVLRFDLRLPANEPPHSNDGVFLGVICPKPHKIVAAERNS